MKYFRPGLTREELKKEYKALAKKFHPDVSKEPNAEVIFKEINEEYNNYQCSSGSYTDPYDFYAASSKNKNYYSHSCAAEAFRNAYQTVEDWYNNFADARAYANAANSRPGSWYYSIIFLVKDTANSYKGNLSFYGDRPIECYMDAVSPEIDYSGFQCVYKDPNDIIPTVHLAEYWSYSIPSNEAMTEYFKNNNFPDRIDWYTKETWIEYIKRNYTIYMYWASDKYNGECYGETQDDTGSFKCYGTKYNEKDDYESRVEEYAVDAKYAKLFRVRDTLNWFDFPLKLYYGYTLDEFIKNYTTESFPPQATKNAYVSDIVVDHGLYRYLYDANLEFIVKCRHIPYHKVVIFCSFSILDLVKYGDEIIEKGIDIKKVQEAIDKINSDSREDLKGLIKKGKVSSGI